MKIPQNKLNQSGKVVANKKTNSIENAGKMDTFPFKMSVATFDILFLFSVILAISFMRHLFFICLPVRSLSAFRSSMHLRPLSLSLLFPSFFNFWLVSYQFPSGKGLSLCRCLSLPHFLQFSQN